MSVATFGYVFIAAMLLANAWASIASLRSDSFSRTHRWVLVAMVWLVPVIGAFVVWIIFAETNKPKSTT